MNDTTICGRCRELIRPDHFGSDRTCAFGPDDVFQGDNWQCPIVNRFRFLALDAAEEHTGRVAGGPADNAPYATEIRDNDERIVTLSMIEATVTSESRTLPEAVILRWYKERGRTDNVLFLRRDGTASAPTLPEIQHVTVELERAFPAWVAAFEERHNG